MTGSHMPDQPPWPCSSTTGGPSPPSSTAVDTPARSRRRSVTGAPASSRRSSSWGTPRRLPRTVCEPPAAGSRLELAATSTTRETAPCATTASSADRARGGAAREPRVERRGDDRRGAGAHDRANDHVARVVHAGVDTRVGDTGREQPDRHGQPREVAADGVGEREGRRISTCRAGDRSATRSGRRRWWRDFMPRLTVAEVTPIETIPSSAARRPRPPPSRAIVAAMASHRREWSAARESRRTGPSSLAVGVRATARYTARSTAPSSRSASTHGDPGPRRASTPRASASPTVSGGLFVSCDMARILGSDAATADVRQDVD